jgi:hypothetical protein
MKAAAGGARILGITRKEKSHPAFSLGNTFRRLRHLMLFVLSSPTEDVFRNGQ